MADWEEVKRLAADFQRAQLSSTKQKLSERNVVEIVGKLIALNLVEVVYTLDGKEYLTPHELAKEIKEELFVHGGRINLVELHQILNVDFSHVESRVNDIIKHDRSLTLVLGQLIDKSYLDRFAEEVNDRLQEQGHITIGELTTLYDLPADFIAENVYMRLGTVIKGQADSYDRDVIFTEAFVSRMKARIRGAFSAITRPTPVMSILNRYEFQERLFYSLLEELVNSGRLAGSITGGRQDKATYVPDIYTKCQNAWVDAFYQQNGYLEYDSLTRLGITDPKGFIKKRYKSEQLVFLSTCCTGPVIQDQIEASVEEALSTGSWIDIMPLLPSSFSRNDANQVLTRCISSQPTAVVCCDTMVISSQFITDCNKPFASLMTDKAEKDAKKNASIFTPHGGKASQMKLMGMEDSSGRDEKKESRRKKATGGTKSGGGTQGREVKMKSTKKKYRTRDQDDDSDDDDTQAVSRSKDPELVFMSVEEIAAVVQTEKELEDCPEELVTEIARKLQRSLNREYQEVAKNIFLQSAGVATGMARRKTHGELQEKIYGLWTNARLFEKGIKQFSDDTQVHLVKHLLKTVCTDLTNMVVNAMAMDHMVSLQDDSQLTTEGRMKIISQLPEEERELLSKLHKSLNEKTLESFFQPFEIVCDAAHLGVALKKPDKKKERQLVFNHRHALMEELNNETEPAMCLHLCSVLLFNTYTQSLVHAPGRCVPQILLLLEGYMDPERCAVLIYLQDMVMQHLKLHSPEAQKDAANLTEKMKELLPKVKEIALTSKKGSSQAAAES